MENAIEVLRVLQADGKLSVLVLFLVFLIGGFFFLSASQGILIKGNADEKGVDRKKAKITGGILFTLSGFFLLLYFFLLLFDFDKECDLLEEIQSSTNRIEAILIQQEISEEEEIILLAFKERFEQYLNRKDFCQNEEAKAIAREELDKIQDYY